MIREIPECHSKEASLPETLTHVTCVEQDTHCGVGRLCVGTGEFLYDRALISSP